MRGEWRSTTRRGFLLGAAGTLGILGMTHTRSRAATRPSSSDSSELTRAGWMRAPEGNVKRGGVARWAGHISTPHFDLHQGAAAWSTVHLYNNLVRYNLVDGLRTIIPDLAERWEISRDGKAYTFFLRRGVTFHDGTPFGADDVVASFRRIIFPPKGMASIMRELFDGVDAVEKTDPFTVRFTLKMPRPYLLEVFTVPNCVIYSKKSLDENNQDLRKVIAPGTGAFMHKERREGEKWILAKNPNYWDKELPYMDGLELLHLPEWTDRGVAVLTGQADLSLNTSVEMFQEGARRGDIVSVRQVPSVGVYFLYFNCERKPL
ncbi:MAG TPA: ABC transporter substrate-binding protein, partial [Candidatus Acidoferrum sp.]|nr:ABC transporter substrate-binding protein [Candidatus Acidoferrum sp.]